MAALPRRSQLNAAAEFQMPERVSRFEMVRLTFRGLARIHSIHQLKVS